MAEQTYDGQQVRELVGQAAQIGDRLGYLKRQAAELHERMDQSSAVARTAEDWLVSSGAVGVASYCFKRLRVIWDEQRDLEYDLAILV
ncbi:MAG: hypothetical protein KKE05_05700 [Nanoarchaeota archaeon]|nr:hypothetical protein [Nanoarchaeota archaeon]